MGAREKRGFAVYDYTSAPQSSFGELVDRLVDEDGFL